MSFFSSFDFPDLYDFLSSPLPAFHFLFYLLISLGVKAKVAN